MPALEMYWDEKDAYGEIDADIRLLAGDTSITIPEDACGFRLERPGAEWNDTWYFRQMGNMEVFEKFGQRYSSFDVPRTGNYIEARGLVRACKGSNGSYTFATPLVEMGINPEQPFLDGAGGFIAQLSNPNEITWLNYAGEELERTEVDFKDPPSKDFFKGLLTDKICVVDFLGEFSCRSIPRDPEHNFLHTLRLGPPRLNLRRSAKLMQTHISNFSGSPEVTRKASSLSKIEVECPVHLVLNCTLQKQSSYEPARVIYRWRFLPTHSVSTPFSTTIKDDTPITVQQSVPIPLPPPINAQSVARMLNSEREPGGRGGISILRRRRGLKIIPGDPVVTAKPLPGHEYKGAYRLEVLNCPDGIIHSNWVNFYISCT